MSDSSRFAALLAEQNSLSRSVPRPALPVADVPSDSPVLLAVAGRLSARFAAVGAVLGNSAKNDSTFSKPSVVPAVVSVGAQYPTTAARRRAGLLTHHAPAFLAKIKDCLARYRAEPVPSDRKQYLFSLQTGAVALLPGERVCNCLRTPHDAEIELKQADGKAFYSGLQTCGSVHVCAVCMAKISERRRLEIQSAIDQWEAAGNSVWFATYTLRHKFQDRYIAVRNVLRGAHRRVKSGRAWQDFKDRYRVVGTITAYEVTYGKNGFHPHIHELLFVQGVIPATERYEADLWLNLRWNTQVRRSGGDTTKEYGFKLVSAPSREWRGDYLVKVGNSNWTYAHELAKSAAKKSRGGQAGRTMLGLLHEYTFLGNNRSGKIWREYALGSKGAHWVDWSRGLKTLFNLDDLDDLAVSSSDSPSDSPESVIVTLSLDEWRRLVSSDVRGQLLEHSNKNNHDLSSVLQFLLDHGVYDGYEKKPEPKNFGYW